MSGSKVNMQTAISLSAYIAMPAIALLFFLLVMFLESVEDIEEHFSLLNC
jgi:hypothetical protein